jgi:hypothetical protein
VISPYLTNGASLCGRPHFRHSVPIAHRPDTSVSSMRNIPSIHLRSLRLVLATATACPIAEIACRLGGRYFRIIYGSVVTEGACHGS